eukprot:TRINITY_DN81467_c0_g1_i1.p1 TRINITY_DN81467_c0_g1~~TRINITY_DN81467_c0_g1_i1.p1  ORF type:complete len:291 (-),score=50.46 TRINITY_DN81467_c0_g1_i1:15-887(-)
MADAHARIAKTASLVDALLPVSRGLGTLFAGMVGMMIGGNLGAIIYPVPPGAGAIMGGIFGLMIFALLGCCITSFWMDLLPSEDIGTIAERQVARMADQEFSYSLVINIKEVTGVSVNGRMYAAKPGILRPEFGSVMSRPSLFVELYTADPQTPVKATCVRKDGVFNEQFIVDVPRSDHTLFFVLKDQQMLGASQVGFVTINTDLDIYTDGKETTLDIKGGEGYSLWRQDWNNHPKLVIAAQTVESTMDGQAHKKTSHLKPEGDQFENHYGAVNFLSAMHFDKKHNATMV